LILVGDDDAVVPAAVLRGVQTGAVDGVAGDVAELLFAVEGGYLILAEERPPFILVAILDSIDPLDQVRLCRGGCWRLCLGRDGCGGNENEDGGKKSDEFAHLCDLLDCLSLN